MEEEIETIDGFDIPKRELTEEEANREVTLERFSEWMREVGEDFIDTHSYGDQRIFLGFVMAKFPGYSKGLLEMFNKEKQSGLFCIQDILHFFEEQSGEEFMDEAWSAFYTVYADFLNHTVHSKKNVNQQLILVMEHYNS